MTEKMSTIQDRLLSKAEDWSFEPVKIREKLKANCTPALKRNDLCKRPGPLIAKHTSDIHLPFGSSSDGMQDKTHRPCRTPSPSSNTSEFTFLNRPVLRRPISPPINRSRRRSPVRTRSRSPPVTPPGVVKRIPSPAGSLDNLQIEAIKKKVKKVQRARLYLLQRPGPNSLLIAGDSPEHKYKVIIGPQTCSCGRPHCIHILFVMLRVFQVSENDPSLFVKDLKNFEVEALFRKYDEKRNKRVTAKPVTTASSLRASSESTLNNKGLDISIGSRSSSMNDIQHSGKDEEQWCPICLLEMLDGESLVTCLSGCKNRLHHHCIVIWSEECKRQNEPVLCPLCRALWTWPENESKLCKKTSTSTSLMPPSAPVPIGHTTHSSSPSTPTSSRNISSLSPVPSLPSDNASTSTSSSSASSSSSTASAHSQKLINSSTSAVPNTKFRNQKIADNYDLWAKTFGEEVIAGVHSRDWNIRENALRQLCAFVVRTLSQYASDEVSGSTIEEPSTSTIVSVCCNILTVIAADPVYKVYISCLRCLRALLACTACRSNSDLAQLQEHVRPVVEAIILKCADGNRRTSQLSVATLVELCRGSSGELAVGRQTRFLAEDGLGGVAYVLNCLLTVHSETSTKKWQWFLSRLYALDRLMEEFPQEFYLLHVEKLAKNLGCFHGGSHLVNYDRLMSVLLFSIQGFNYQHATVRKIARRVFIMAARLTSHVQGVFTQVCDMLAPVDAALQAKLKHRLCAISHKLNAESESKRDCNAPVEIDDSKVVYTSVRLPSRRHSFGRSTPSSPTQLPDRSLILEKLGKDLFVCCDCRSPKRTRPPPRLRRSASYTPSVNSPLDLRNGIPGIGQLPSSSSSSHVNAVPDSSCNFQGRCDLPRQRPNFLPLPANNRCNDNDSFSYPRTRIAAVTPRFQCGVANCHSSGMFHGDIPLHCAASKASYHCPSSSSQSFHPGQLHRSITRRSSDPVGSSHQCPVGDLIDLSIPVPSEVPRTGFAQLSFKSEIVTPTTPVNNGPTNVAVSSAKQTALQRKKEVVYEEAVLLMKSLTKLSIQSSLPSIPGLTDIPFDTTKYDLDYNEGLNSTDSKEVNYLEGVHWLRGPLLGTGAFSSCFQARDIKTGTLMAVKQISLCCSSTDSQNSKMENIHDEIMMMTKLDHPNVVRLMGATQQGSYYNMFVEWMPGGSVAALLDRYGPFTEDVMVRYLHQVLAGLAYLHEKHILHRDLKGANLLVDSTGHYLRIGDFGAAARLASQRTVADEFKGQLLGTIAFMAPEVLRGEGYGRSSDVWSVGCIIIEMSTTKPPWDAVNISNDLALLFKIACSHGPPPIPESLPPGIRDIALRCLEQKSTDRPPAKELLHHACFSMLNESTSSKHRSCTRV